MLEALLRFLFVLVIIYYGFKLIIKYVLPWILARFVKKQQEKYQNMNSGFENDYRSSNQSDVKIKTNTPNKNNDEDDGFGEYIDFEEIKE